MIDPRPFLNANGYNYSGTPASGGHGAREAYGVIL